MPNENAHGYLENNARSWHEGWPATSLCSLKDFYAEICKNYKQNYPSIVLIKIFCGKFDDLIQPLGLDIYDKDLMYDEFEEDLFDLYFHQDGIIEASCHHIQENLQ